MYNFIQKYSLKISMLSFVMVFSLVLFMKFFDKNIFLFLLCFFFLAIGVTFYPPKLNNKLKGVFLQYLRDFFNHK